MSTTENYLIPMPSGQTAKISREHYDALIGKSHLTVYSLTTVGAAAQILAHVVREEDRSLRDLVRLVHGDPEIEPSAAERRAIVALAEAKLVERIGNTASVRFRLPAAE